MGRPFYFETQLWIVSIAAMTHFFKKATPATPVYLSTGAAIYFERINSMVGVYRTEDAGIVAEFDRAIQAQRGGIFRIEEAEYARIMEKKTTASRQNWRDEFGKGNIPQVRRPENDLVSHAAGESVSQAAAVPAKQAPKPPGSGFRPTARK